MPVSVMFILLAAVALIPVAVIPASLPMIRRRVKPNSVYGLRTAKTLSNERIWYDANAYAGRMLLRAGIVGLVGVVAAAVVGGIGLVDAGVAAGAAAATVFVPQAWAFVRSLAYLKTL
jgi:hypothetical protein